MVAVLFKCDTCEKTFKVNSKHGRKPTTCSRCLSEPQGNTFVPQNRLPSYFEDDSWNTRRLNPQPMGTLAKFLITVSAVVASLPVLGVILMHAGDRPQTLYEWKMCTVMAAVMVVAVAFYFLPTIIAITRGHANAVPLAIVNAAFGWSGIGFIACLAWSCAAQK